MWLFGFIRFSLWNLPACFHLLQALFLISFWEDSFKTKSQSATEELCLRWFGWWLKVLFKRIRRDKKPTLAEGYLELSNFRESLECLYLFLYFGNWTVDFIKLFEHEKTIAYGTLEQNVETHKSWRYIYSLATYKVNQNYKQGRITKNFTEFQSQRPKQ